MNQQNRNDINRSEDEERKKQIRFPKFCKVVDADGEKLGKVENSVCYNFNQEEQGKFFRKADEETVSYKRRPSDLPEDDASYTELLGYVGKDDGVYTPAGEYLFTLKYPVRFPKSCKAVDADGNQIGRAENSVLYNLDKEEQGKFFLEADKETVSYKRRPPESSEDDASYTELLGYVGDDNAVYTPAGEYLFALKYRVCFPKFCKVVDADGEKLGKVRNSVLYNFDKEEQGKFFFEADTDTVSYKRRSPDSPETDEYTELLGYVDEDNNVYTPAGEYLFTLEYRARFPKSCKVVNADGDKIGKVKKSVCYNLDKEEQGKFFLGTDGKTVSYKRRFWESPEDDDTDYTDIVGYVNEDNDVYTPAGQYLFTLKYRKWFILFILFFVFFLFILFLSMFFVNVSRDYIPTLFVTEVGGSEWTETEPITVFENGVYNESKICPGMEGTYSFRLENRNPDTLVYELTFTDVNQYEINLGYRLLRNGEYVTSSTEYVPVTELNFKDLTVDAKQNDTFTLEWKWLHNDDVDTIAGMESATYTLFIRFNATIQTNR